MITRIDWTAVRVPAEGSAARLTGVRQPQAGTALLDTVRRWMLGLRADHHPGSIDALTAVQARAGSALRAVDAVLQARSPAGLLVIDRAGDLPLARQLRWRLALHGALYLQPPTGSSGGNFPDNHCVAFGQAVAPAHLRGLLVERLLSCVVVPDEARSWLLLQLPPLLRGLDACLPTATAIETTIAPSRDRRVHRSLADAWLHAHCAAPGMPMPLRWRLPALAVPLAALAERDPGLWQCALHPARRLLRDWMASLQWRVPLDRAVADGIDDEFAAMRALIDDFPSTGATAAAAVHPLVLRSRALRDAGFPAWCGSALGGLGAANDSSLLSAGSAPHMLQRNARGA